MTVDALSRVHVRLETNGRDSPIVYLVALEFSDRSVFAWRLADVMSGRTILPSLIHRGSYE